MGNAKKVKRKKLKIKLKAKDGTEEYVLGDNQTIPDQTNPNPTPQEIETALQGIPLDYVGAIFYSHSSPG